MRISGSGLWPSLPLPWGNENQATRRRYTRNNELLRVESPRPLKSQVRLRYGGMTSGREKRRAVRHPYIRKLLRVLARSGLIGSPLEISFAPGLSRFLFGL